MFVGRGAGAAPLAGEPFGAEGMDFAVAFRLEGATLPPAARAGTMLLDEKSVDLPVAAIAGLPPFLLTSN